jgi:hypothetical protein
MCSCLAHPQIDKELCLDMSDFNQISHDFTTFVDLLFDYEEGGVRYVQPEDPSKTPREALLFEEKLLFIYLPDFQVFSDVSHHGIKRLFLWLRENKKVKSVKRLAIPDNVSQPMSEDFVAEHILKNLTVEELDWRKLDADLMALSYSDQRLRRNLREIILYSSGSWPVLYHWASVDGLRRFSNVCGSNSAL